MKTLQKKVQTLYRFRCAQCGSKFEMTEEEKIENDWKFTNCYYSGEKHGYVCGPVNRDKDYRSNHSGYFDCPVCKCVSWVRRNDMHEYIVMDDGTEIMRY